MAFNLDSGLYSRLKTSGDFEREAQAAQLNDQKLQSGKMESASKYLGLATPENWQQIRSKAISEGLGDESIIPQEYNPEWINGAKNAFDAHKSNNFTPSAIQEYNLYKQLAPGEQEQYLNVKRANSPLNLGDHFGRVSPVTNQVTPVADINISPNQAPELKGEQQDAKNQSDVSFAATKASAAAEGKIAGEAQGARGKKESQAIDNKVLIEEAKKILPNATSGGFSKNITGVKNYFGESTASSKADRRLNILSAALTSGVPRFEGPQSNIDVESYKQAAADVANKDVPYEDRLAALDTMNSLQDKYAKNEGRLANTQPQGKFGKNLNSPIKPSTIEKTIVKTQVSPSSGKRKIIYSDGTEEIQDAQ